MLGVSDSAASVRRPFTPILSPPKTSFPDPSLLMPIHRFVLANLMFPSPTSFAYSPTLAPLAVLAYRGNPMLHVIFADSVLRREG